MKQDALALYEYWKTAPCFDEATHRELAALDPLDDADEIYDRFCCELGFGTGGLRGLMGAGTNRINSYVVQKTTRALIAWLQQARPAGKGVAVAYDSRLCSRQFAEDAALVLCQAGIKTYFFDDIVPTPLLSYAIPHLGCQAGIVITASHNPKEYNGYKIYNAQGGQILPDAAEEISRLAAELTPWEASGPQKHADIYSHPNFKLIDAGGSLTQTYLRTVLAQARPGGARDDNDKAGLRIVYTPLHGAGWRMVPKLLCMAGFAAPSLVEAQATPNGHFPTVPTPNPEEPEVLALAIEKAKAENADIVLGTDPDCDRICVAVKDGGDYRVLTGNQIGALLVDYISSIPAEKKPTPKKALVKTIVTGDLGAVIARDRGFCVMETLTGFKHIGEVVSHLEGREDVAFALGYEESCGYLAGTHARDKDALAAALLICDMAAAAKARGTGLPDVLDALYEKYGYYADKTVRLALPAGALAPCMRRVRAHYGDYFADIADVYDYAAGRDGLAPADVVKLIFTDGSWAAVRPSGTEPLLKLYFSAKGAGRESAEKRLDALHEKMLGLVNV